MSFLLPACGRDVPGAPEPARDGRGTWTGPSEILDGFLATMFAALDPAAPVPQDLHRIIADGDWAVAEWTSHARARNGAPYDNDHAAIFHVTGGHIDAVTEYCDTSYLRRILFDQESGQLSAPRLLLEELAGHDPAPSLRKSGEIPGLSAISSTEAIIRSPVRIRRSVRRWRARQN